MRELPGNQAGIPTKERVVMRVTRWLTRPSYLERFILVAEGRLGVQPGLREPLGVVVRLPEEVLARRRMARKS